MIAVVLILTEEINTREFVLVRRTTDRRTAVAEAFSKAERSEQRALWNHILIMFTLFTWKMRCSSIAVDSKEHNRLFSDSQIFESCVPTPKVWLCFCSPRSTSTLTSILFYFFAVSRVLWAEVKTQACQWCVLTVCPCSLISHFFHLQIRTENIAHSLPTSATNRLVRYSAKTHVCKNTRLQSTSSCCGSECS